MKQQTTTSNHMQALWRALLIALSGDHNKIPEMRVELKPEHVPSDMPFERDLLRVYYRIAKNGGVPNRTGLINGLVILCKRDSEQATKMVDRLLAEEIAGCHLSSLAAWVYEDVKQREAEAAWSKATGVISSNVGNWDERNEEALRIVADVKTPRDALLVYSEKERRDWFYQETDRHYAEYLNGDRRTGPLLPWDGFMDWKDNGSHYEGIIPSLDWGQQTTITCRTGGGKSTTAGVIAEANAWIYGICDVLSIHLETNHNKMHSRSLARNCFIPGDHIRSKAFSRRDQRYAKALVEYDRKVDASEYQIWYAFAPSSSAFQISNLIRLYRARAAARGHGLLVLLDYFQKVDWQAHSRNKTEGFGEIANILRDTLEIENTKSPVHLLVLAQESGEGDDTKAFYCKELIFVSQVYMSLQRKSNNGDHKLKDLPYGKPGQYKNALGGQRYFHRAGDRFDSNATFVIYKGNDYGAGQVRVNFENSLYRIVSNRKPVDYPVRKV